MKSATTKYAHKPLNARGHVTWLSHKFASLFVCLALSTGCSSPDQDYEKAFQADDISEYQLVLKKHPDHLRAKEASSRLGELLWQSVRQEPKTDALKALIRKYPQADFTRDATLLLDDVSWEAAKVKNTIQSYIEYTESFPAGKFITQAQLGIEGLTWQAAFDSDSVEVLGNFIVEFPQSERKNEAERRIKHLQKQRYVKVFEQDDLEEFKKLNDGALEKKIHAVFGWPPLLIAADMRSEKIAAYLIEKGSDVNERGDDKATALHLAVRSGSMPIVNLLVSSKADLDAGIAPPRRTIHFSSTGQLASVETEASAAISAGTPVHWAAKHSQLDILKFLFEKGANK